MRTKVSGSPTELRLLVPGRAAAKPVHCRANAPWVRNRWCTRSCWWNAATAANDAAAVRLVDLLGAPRDLTENGILFSRAE